MPDLMLFISFLGSWKFILFLNILILFKLKLSKINILIIISSLSNLFIIEPLKLFFREPRPLNALIVENSFSFPSGHAYSAITFYGLLTYLLYKKYKHKSIPVLGTIFIFLIAYSRLYLHVHYPIDIITSLLLGLVTLLSVIPTINKQNLLHFRHPILEIALIILLIFSQKLKISPLLSVLPSINLFNTLLTIIISVIACIAIIIITHYNPNLLIDTTKVVNHPRLPKFMPLILYPLISVTIQEILFRWFLLEFTQSIFISSLLFGLIHLPFSKTMAFGTFILGIWWSYLYQSTGNLWYPIISHSLIGNTLIYLAIYKYNKNALPR